MKQCFKCDNTAQNIKDAFYIMDTARHTDKHERERVICGDCIGEAVADWWEANEYLATPDGYSITDFTLNSVRRIDLQIHDLDENSDEAQEAFAESESEKEERWNEFNNSR